MSLINLEDDTDSFLSDVTALERLTQQISTLINDRDVQNSATGNYEIAYMIHPLSVGLTACQSRPTEYNKISTRLKIQIRQFENEYKQLQRKLQQQSTKITSDEYERRKRQLERLDTVKFQLDSRFKETAASSSRARLLETSNRNIIADDDPILDTSTSIDTFRSEQQQIIRQQDDSLEALSKVISRQKNIAIRIGSEVDTQNDILDNLTTQMDNVGTRVSSTTQNVNHVADKDSTYGYWMVIILLFVAIVIILIL